MVVYISEKVRLVDLFLLFHFSRSVSGKVLFRFSTFPSAYIYARKWKSETIGCGKTRDIGNGGRRVYHGHVTFAEMSGRWHCQFQVWQCHFLFWQCQISKWQCQILLFGVKVVTTEYTETPSAALKAAGEKRSSKHPAPIFRHLEHGRLPAVCTKVSFLLLSVSRECGLRCLPWCLTTI